MATEYYAVMGIAMLVLLALGGAEILAMVSSVIGKIFGRRAPPPDPVGRLPDDERP